MENDIDLKTYTTDKFVVRHYDRPIDDILKELKEKVDKARSFNWIKIELRFDEHPRQGYYELVICGWRKKTRSELDFDIQCEQLNKQTRYEKYLELKKEFEEK